MYKLFNLLHDISLLYYNKILSIIFFYWIIYIFSMLCIYIIISNILSIGDCGLFLIVRLHFFKKISIYFLISLLSIAGIPPFIGFWSKIISIITITHTFSMFNILIFWIFLFYSLLFYLNILRYIYIYDCSNIFYKKIFFRQNHINFIIVSSFFTIFGVLFIYDIFILFYIIFL